MNGRTVVVAFALASLFVPSATDADPPEPDKTAAGGRPEKIIREVFEAHNRERAKARLAPLTLDPKLTAAAQTHAYDMAAHQTMTHDGSDGSSPSVRIKRQGYHFQNDGENVAEGYRTVDDLMRGWMNSPPHRENILGKFSQVGIAVARDDDGKPYWAADFGTPWERLDPSHAADDLIKAVNRERTSAGLKPLTSREKLNTAAAQIAREFAEAESFDRKGDDLIAILKKLGYRYRRLAESAASGQPEAADVLKTWMDSPAHKDHLLGDFTEIGVGYADAKSGKPYWALILARPLRD